MITGLYKGCLITKDLERPMRKNDSYFRIPWCILNLVFICIIELFMIQSIHANSLTSLQADLPKQVGRWSAQSGDRVFDEKTIFGYINGAAEVYKAYNFRQCLSRQYIKSGGPAIILDIFDMGSPEDAYGVFTHDLDGARVDIGQDGRLRPGWLSFWKSRFFVSIYAEQETTAAQQAVKELGRQVAGKITGKSSIPEIVLKLPPAGLQTESIRYMHHPVVLNYHYYLSDENILNISSDTDAVLAEYQLDEQTARMLLVEYPALEKAAKSRAGFLKHYIPDADQMGTALLENGKWAAIQGKGSLLAIVLEADSKQLAEHLLENVQ